MSDGAPLRGSCQCGRLHYRIAGPLGPVVSCHCSFCRRVHGAAFTTVALAAAEAIAWTDDSATPAVFETPLGNRRHFCGHCASPLWNLSPSLGMVAVVVGSLSEAAQPAPWAHVNTESQAPWYEIRDALPRFLAWPTAGELRGLCERHPEAWLPEPLLAGEA